MVMHKDMRSHEGPVILSSGDQTKMFPKGFEYSVDDIIYRVVECISDGPTEMRKVTRSDGGEEILTVAHMIRDFTHGSHLPTVINDGIKKEAEVEEKKDE